MPTNEVAIDHRIPAAIFAARSRPLAELVDFMVKLVAAGELQPHELPDLIVTLDKGILFHSPSVSTSILRRVFSAAKAKGSRAFLAFGPEQNSLALFLLLLYSVTPPEPHLAEPVLKRYLEFSAPNMMYEY